MKKLLYIIPLMCMVALSSCDDALDLEPKDKIKIEDAFTTEQQLELFTKQFYEAILVNAMDNNPCFEEQDDCKINDVLSAVMKGGTYRNVPASGGGWSWSPLRRINTMLEYVDQWPKEDVEYYTAVCKFFRAYFYFQKVRRFGDVPWIDRQLEKGDPLLYAPRDSREFIMTKMLEDIDYAIEHLNTKEKEKLIPYRITQGAALALKSNFCLFEGTFRKYHGISLEGHDWQYYLSQCVDASEKLMGGKYGKYKLYNGGNPTEDYMMLFAEQDANTDEFILAVRYAQGAKVLHNANAHTLVATQGQPGYTRKFVCTYLMKNGKRFTDTPGWQQMQFGEEIKNRDPRLTQSIRGYGYHRIGAKAILPADLAISLTGYHPIKFVGQSKKDGINMDKNNMSSNDLPEFRYAEVLLNLAEAKAELGTLTQSDIDKTVNELRKRVGMTGMLKMADANANPDPYLDGDISPESGYFNVTGDNKGVILEIRRERTIELIQEGRRWYDLMRWKCGKMVDQPLLGQYFPGPGEYDMSGNGNADVVFKANGAANPKVPAGAKLFEMGKDMFFTDGNSGCLDNHRGQTRQGFNEGRDYLYPIPTDEISLNPNLTQNPGW